MLILGIDPGTQILGYSILDTDGTTPRIVAMDVLYLKKIPEFNLRIRQIFLSTSRLIDSFHPDHLAIEAPFFGKNVQSMLKLGRAQGVAIAAAISRDLSVTEYEPSVIKQHITGNGNASKQQVATMLQSILGFDQSPHYFDATDALAIALCHYYQTSSPLASPGSSSSWEKFLAANPGRIKK